MSFSCHLVCVLIAVHIVFGFEFIQFDFFARANGDGSISFREEFGRAAYDTASGTDYYHGFPSNLIYFLIVKFCRQVNKVPHFVTLGLQIACQTMVILDQNRYALDYLYSAVSQ